LAQKPLCCFVRANSADDALHKAISIQQRQIMAIDNVRRLMFLPVDDDGNALRLHGSPVSSRVNGARNVSLSQRVGPQRLHASRIVAGLLERWHMRSAAGDLDAIATTTARSPRQLNKRSGALKAG
jgi:hypothetical protein